MGGAVSSFAGSGPATPPNLQTYQPQYMSQADQSAFSNINQINNNNPYLQNQAQYQNIQNQSLNNPYAAGQQPAANQAGQQYAQVGQQGAQVASGLNQGAMSLLPYVSQVENTAMDPQNALYNQTLQQVQNQANVSNAQNGLTNSPFGAGVANQANNQFNMNWQNQQLGRQEGGISAAATGLGAVGAAGSNAQNIGNSAAGATGMSGAVPNTAYLGNLANQQTALNNYGQSQANANQQTQTAESDFMNYLGNAEAQDNAQQKLNQTNYQNQQNYIQQQNAQLAGQVNSGLSLVGAMPGQSGAGTINQVLGSLTGGGQQAQGPNADGSAGYTTSGLSMANIGSMLMGMLA